MALTPDQQAWAQTMINSEYSVVLEGRITDFDEHPTQPGTVVFTVTGDNGEATFAQIAPESDRDRAEREANEQRAAEAAMAEAERLRAETEAQQLEALGAEIQKQVKNEVARAMGGGKNAK